MGLFIPIQAAAISHRIATPYAAPAGLSRLRIVPPDTFRCMRMSFTGRCGKVLLMQICVGYAPVMGCPKVSLSALRYGKTATYVDLEDAGPDKPITIDLKNTGKRTVHGTLILDGFTVTYQARI